jgi:ribulose-phosphate 3-epimerase
VTHLPLEAHLMISNPDFFVDEFVQAETDSFLVHWEGNNNLSRTVQSIKALGKRVGVAINLANPATVLEEIMKDLDQVLVMTVNPGFGHQHFLHTTLPKIRRARQMININFKAFRTGCSLPRNGNLIERPHGRSNASLFAWRSETWGARIRIDRKRWAIGA